MTSRRFDDESTNQVCMMHVYILYVYLYIQSYFIATSPAKPHVEDRFYIEQKTIDVISQHTNMGWFATSIVVLLCPFLVERDFPNFIQNWSCFLGPHSQVLILTQSHTLAMGNHDCFTWRSHGVSPNTAPAVWIKHKKIRWGLEPINQPLDAEPVLFGARLDCALATASTASGADWDGACSGLPQDPG